MTVRGWTTAVAVRELSGEERGRAFERFVAVEPAYGRYRQRTERTIPVFELRPAAG